MTHRRSRFVASLLLTALCASATGARGTAQADWKRKELVRRLARHTMAYDSARDRTVVFGGMSGELTMLPRGETWEFDSRAWSQRHPGKSPPARHMAAMVYDSGRACTVLLGGVGGDPTQGYVNLGDLWEWDGVEWTEQKLASVPPVRHQHAMAYDSSRQRVVVFAGVGGQAPNEFELADTWEFDGTKWTQGTPSTKPNARWGGAMAYDAARKRTVLFGGAAGQSVFGETWEWDGTNWTQRWPVTSPAARAAASMTYDPQRQRIVLFGGLGMSGDLEDTWEWDGTNWTEVKSALRPRKRYEHAMAYEASSGRTLLFGGAIGSGLNGDSAADTWAWNGKVWLPVEPSPSPALLDSFAATYDGVTKSVIVFGGTESLFPLDNTWSWNGRIWKELAPKTTPPARAGAAMAYHASRRESVMFGGSALLFTVLGDTWVWNGSDWARRVPKTNPPPREHHGMAYDSRRGRTVMFGGEALIVFHGDTWEWDGTDWTKMTPKTSPSPRKMPAMAFDPVHGYTLLFGGEGATSPHDDTWKWDGTNWTKLRPTNKPPAAYENYMTYDSVRRRIVLVSGVNGRTYEWDGSDWTKTNAANRIPAQVVFDAARGQTVCFDGMDTWVYDTRAAAAAQRTGTPCGGTTAPELTDFGHPEFGNTSFGLDVVGGRPRMPAFVMFSVRPANTPIGSCKLYVDLSGLLLTRPLLLGGTGFGHVSVPIPALRALSGLTLHAQAGVVDPNSNALGLALTGGLSFVIGE